MECKNISWTNLNLSWMKVESGFQNLEDTVKEGLEVIYMLLESMNKISIWQYQNLQDKM
jgi:hypothetical protein